MPISTPKALRAKPDPIATPLSAKLLRFFFYGWLFRDMNCEGVFARNAARAHNAIQGRWLPLYMFRWAVMGGLLVLLEAFTERLTGNSPLAASLAIGLAFIVLFQRVTGLCWVVLTWRRMCASH